MKRTRKIILFLFLAALSLPLAYQELSAKATWMEKIQQRRQERRERWLGKIMNTNLESDSQKFYIEHQGRKRYYLVFVPESYNENIPSPVVLNFHGGGGSAEGHQKTSKMNEKANSAGFIAVYPAGTRPDGDPNRPYKRFWNYDQGPTGPYNTHPLTSSIDDVGFVKKILDDLESKFNIDKKRVYATGFSNGAILTQFLACTLSDRIAAIAPVAGPFWQFSDKCNPSRAVSVIYFHGTSDKCAPFDGGPSGCEKGLSSSGRIFPSVKDTIDNWVNKDSCNSKPKLSFQNGDVTCKTYSCREDSEVTSCTINGGGHTWPGGRPYTIPGVDIGKTTNDINADDAMWEFFKKHPKK